MVRVLGLLFAASAVFWSLGEAVLLLRQRLKGGPARLTERRSLVVIYLAAGAAVLAVAILRRMFVVPIFPVRTIALAVALPVFWAGLVVRLWSIRTLGRFFRVVVHVQEDHQVVRSGPYKVLRHPSYAGLLLGVLAACVVTNDVVILLVVLLAAVPALLYRIRVEERTLLRELGQPYADYAAHTRRLIPGVW